MKKRTMTARALSVLAVLMLGLVAGGSAAAAAERAVGEGRVSGSYANAYFVDQWGNLWGWGANYGGQLGEKPLPYDANNPSGRFLGHTKLAENVRAVWAGEQNVLYLSSAGTLYGLGDNSRGQLGVQTDEPQCTTPVQVMDNVVRLDRTDWGTFAVDGDGGLWVWGENRDATLGFRGGNAPHTYDGEIDYYDQTTPLKLLDDVVSVSAGVRGGVAVKTDGTAWAWGEAPALWGLDQGDARAQTFYGVPYRYYSHPVQVMDQVSEVRLLKDGAAALGSDGVLRRWDRPAAGETPTYRRLSGGVAAIWGQGNDLLALKEDGSLWSGRGGEELTHQLDDVVDAACAPVGPWFAVKADGTPWSLWPAHNPLLGFNEYEILGYPLERNAAAQWRAVTIKSVPSSWALSEVRQAEQAGIVPASLQRQYQSGVTRAQFAELIVKTVERGGGELTPGAAFLDCKLGYVRKARLAGIVEGVGENRFDPDAGITRQEIAKMVMSAVRYMDRAIGKTGDQPLSPAEEAALLSGPMYAEVSTWARSYLLRANRRGIVVGVGGGSFDPLGSATCEQAILMIWRASQDYLKAGGVIS